jgi:phosphatidylserine synthase
MRWSVGWFGVKDLFTMLNLLGGVLGIYWAAEGNPTWAAFAILGGYFLGDALDGPVARATGTGNRFGAEFDSAADHLGQGIAPAVVVFAAYRAHGDTRLGLALMALLITTASLRQARFNVDRFDFPLAYCGLPRTISGIVALSCPNSTVLAEGPCGPTIGAGIIVGVAILNLVPIPYMTHRGGRKMQLWAKLLVISFLTLPLIFFVLAPHRLFDLMLIYGLGYTAGGWLPLSRQERSAYFVEYRRWARVLATAK